MVLTLRYCREFQLHSSHPGLIARMISFIHHTSRTLESLLPSSINSSLSFYHRQLSHSYVLSIALWRMTFVVSNVSVFNITPSGWVCCFLQGSIFSFHNFNHHPVFLEAPKNKSHFLTLPINFPCNGGIGVSVFAIFWISRTLRQLFLSSFTFLPGWYHLPQGCDISPAICVLMLFQPAFFASSLNTVQLYWGD